MGGLSAMRFAGPLAAAVLFAFSLFWLMHTLIHGRHGLGEKSETLPTIDFVRLNKNFELETKSRERPPPEKPQKPQAAPTPLAVAVQTVDAPTANLSVPIGNLTVVPDVQVGTGLSLSKNDLANDGDYLPIVKVEPIYPSGAQSRGIEGYVQLSFTVTVTGTVIDPIVIESQPKGVFDEAAIKAVLKFKYKPRVENGKPVQVAGVQQVLSFKIDKGRRQ